MCIAILTDPPFIPTHTYLMNRADEYYVKGVYLGVVCCCFFFSLQVLSYTFLFCHDGYMDGSTSMNHNLNCKLAKVEICGKTFSLLIIIIR